jgi:type IX secretion system PorP/SprF family membrane protein
MRRILLATFILLTIIKDHAIAQDIHFSQIHSSPIRLNPALTGLFNGDVRFIGNYKSQWKKISADFNTYSASLDGKVLFLRNKSFVNLGMNCYSDRAGDLGYSKNQANISASIVKSISKYQVNYISVGIEGGYLNQTTNYTKLHVFDSEDRLLNKVGDKTENFDFSGGINWYYSPMKRMLFYLGGALYHINEPDLSFEKEAGISKETLYKKTVLTGGAELTLKSGLTLMPSFISFDQGPHKEITLGSYVRHTLSYDDNLKSSRFYYGAWFRWYFSGDNEYSSGTDALILAVRLDYKNMVYSVSYDINVSRLSKVSKTEGGPELSILYIVDLDHSSGTKKKRKQILCPSF